MESVLAGILTGLAEKHAIILTILTVVGTARLILKPLMVFLHSVAEITPTIKDNEILKQIESSKVYKSTVFVFDYLLSIKLPKGK